MLQRRATSFVNRYNLTEDDVEDIKQIFLETLWFAFLEYDSSDPIPLLQYTTKAAVHKQLDYIRTTKNACTVPSQNGYFELRKVMSIYNSNYVKAIAPLTGEKPTDLQRAHIKEQKAAAQQTAAPEPIYKVHTNPRSENIKDRYFLQAYLPQEDGKAKIGDVLYIGTSQKCRELMAQLVAGELTQEQVKELYTKAQEQPEEKWQTKELPVPDDTISRKEMQD